MALKRRGKAGIWWYSFKFAGRRIHESSKSTSKTVAKEAERQRHRQLEETWNQITKRALPPPFEKAADAWYESVKPHLAERTKSIYDVTLRCHLKPALGPVLLCDITAQRIGEYQAGRRTEGASARTLNKELQVLRMILKRHKMWANLQGDVKFEREPEGIGRALSPEEETALLTACDSNPLLRAVVTLALNTTMRDHEIKGLRWRQVDFFERILTVGKSKTEAGRGRVIPLNADATKALANWAEHFPERKAEHYAFSACENARMDTGNPDMRQVDPSRPIKSWRTAWRHARTVAGVKVRFHDLRHTTITKLAESQASDQTIMSIAGHVSRKMLEHYSHIRMAAKRAALDAISTRRPEPVCGKVPVFEGEGHQKVHQLAEAENADARNLLN
ncbi:MAG: tyrosine-type recombinase/integrase [Terriglobia bacterium]